MSQQVLILRDVVGMDERPLPAEEEKLVRKSDYSIVGSTGQEPYNVVIQSAATEKSYRANVRAPGERQKRRHTSTRTTT